MATLTMVQAVREALKGEMKRDSNVVILGADVGNSGGVFRATEGLQGEFGKERVMDAPLNASGMVGTAVGMAVNGLRPTVEIAHADFVYPALDQIINEVAKIRYRSGGDFSCPMVVRVPSGGGMGGGLYHSQSVETFFSHVAGLKVVMPSNPYDAKGLLNSAVRAEDPVIFMEPKRLYNSLETEVPEEQYTVEIGKAQVAMPGEDVTVLCWGAMVSVCMEAAELSAAQGIECEVLDVRTLVPLDEKSIVESVKKTGRVVIVHEAPRTMGFGAELSALIAEQAILYMEAPVVRVTGFDTPFPYRHESKYLPDAARIASAVKKVRDFK